MLITVVRQAIMESENPPIRPFADGPLIKAVSDDVVRRRYYSRIPEKAVPDEDQKKLANGNGTPLTMRLEQPSKART
jgi:hypothetical protein